MSMYKKQKPEIPEKQQMKESQSESPSNSINSSQEEEEDNEEEMNSFVADDNDSISYLQEKSDDSEGKKKRRRKKERRAERKRRKRQQQEVDEELWQDDLELLAQNQRQGFTKLKKKLPNQPHIKQQPLSDDDLVDPQSYSYSHGNRSQKSSSDVDDHYQKQQNIEDIFQPGYDDMLLKNQDEALIDHDVPERLLIKYKGQLQENDIKTELNDEAIWICTKLLETRLVKQKSEGMKDVVLKILTMMRVEYCQIMYIYYYKRHIWVTEFPQPHGLETLWGIHNLDDEWLIVRNMRKHLTQVMFPQLESLGGEVDEGVMRGLDGCGEIGVVRLTKEYADYQLLKKGKVGRKEKRRSELVKLLTEMGQNEDVRGFLEKDNVWLLPWQFAENLKLKGQKYKPNTPRLSPKDQIQLLIKDRPYLNEAQIYDTISIYLKNQLFHNPQLRTWMKAEYFRRAVVVTTPTKKGQEDIGLYSMYYPVKRIERKPLSGFTGEMWLIMTEAEKMNNITLDILYDWQKGPIQVPQVDSILIEMVNMYFDHDKHNMPIIDFWNLLRREVLQDFVTNMWIPYHKKEIRMDMARMAEKEILEACADRFRVELNKGPTTGKDGKSTAVMGMVLQGEKLGLAIVDEDGNLKFKGMLKLPIFANLNTVVTDKAITDPIEQFKPELIVVAANCRQALTLRKQLRQTKGSARQQRGEFCSLGQYEVCSRLAKYQMWKTGTNEEKAVLEAIALCRLEQNAMAEILNVWSEKIQDNGCLMLGLHPLQKTVNKYKLKAELEKVAIQMVNLVGLDLRKVKDNVHLQKQVQFVCGLGQKKAIHFLQKLKIFDEKELKRRFQLHTDNIVGKVVYRNCSGFFRICTPAHQQFLQNGRLDKRQDKQNAITLLDTTRIHDESFSVVQEAAMVAVGDSNKKKMDYEQCIAEVMKNPSKFKTVQFDKDAIDLNFILQELQHPFKDPRNCDQQIDNHDAFFSILRQSPDTLKKYMVFSTKVVNTSSNFLNVKVMDNGLFGSIRLPHDDRPDYPKDSIIKAVLTRFPFQPAQQKKKQSSEGRQDQQLLKVDMSLTFPHFTNIRPGHDCHKDKCYTAMIQLIHPALDARYFQILRQDIPVLQARQDIHTGSQIRLFNHPKFKNMGITQAIEWIKTEPIGDFIVRPSATKKDYLTITWKFYEGVICHINLRAQPRTTAPHSYIFRIEQKDKQRTYSSFDQMISHYIKPMNRIMQDVISYRKFHQLKPLQLEDKLKEDFKLDPTVIHYGFGVSSDYPKFIILFYIPKEAKVVKELIRIKDTGLLFHEQTFADMKILTAWFKGNFMTKDYQKQIPKSGTIKFK